MGLLHYGHQVTKMASRFLKISPLLKLGDNSSLTKSMTCARSASAAMSYKQALANAPPTRLSVLNNGLRVASEDSDAPTATIGVFINNSYYSYFLGVSFFFPRTPAQPFCLSLCFLRCSSFLYRIMSRRLASSGRIFFELARLLPP